MYPLTQTTSTDQLVREIIETGVSSFVELAIRDPDIWIRLRHDAELRAAIAKILNWRSEFNFDVIAMNDVQIFELLLNAGYASIADFWREDAGMAIFFLGNGMLKHLVRWFELLDGTDSDIRDIGDVSMERCLTRIHTLGSLEIWADVEPRIYEFTRGERWFAALEEQAPRRPCGGYVTRGGVVHETPELIVARILEMGNIEFKSEVYLPCSGQRFPFVHFKLKIGKASCGVFIRRTGRWTVERFDDECLSLAKEACHTLGIQLLIFDGNVFFDGGGVDGYFSYVCSRLKAQGILDDTSGIDVKRCLTLHAL